MIWQMMPSLSRDRFEIVCIRSLMNRGFKDLLTLIRFVYSLDTRLRISLRTMASSWMMSTNWCCLFSSIPGNSFIASMAALILAIGDLAFFDKVFKRDSTLFSAWLCRVMSSSISTNPEKRPARFKTGTIWVFNTRLFFCKIKVDTVLVT